MVKMNSQKEVVETKIAPFELHSNNCRLCMKHTRISEHHFLVKYKNITERETAHLDLLTEEFTIYEIIACASKAQNFIKTIDDDIRSTLSNIKVYDCKPVIDFSIKISKKDFSWELFVFQKTISKQLIYFLTLPSFINQSNVQTFFNFYLEFHIYPGKSDFPKAIKNKFAHGTDLIFIMNKKMSKQKLKTKILVLWRS